MRFLWLTENTMAEWNAESYKNAALYQRVGWVVDMATKPGLYANIHAKTAKKVNK